MTHDDALEVSGLIHSKWVETFESLKTVKNERNDSSPDWEEFHQLRLDSAKLDEQKWSDIKDRFMTEHRHVFLKMFGNS